MSRLAQTTAPETAFFPVRVLLGAVVFSFALTAMSAEPVIVLWPDGTATYRDADGHQVHVTTVVSYPTDTPDDPEPPDQPPHPDASKLARDVDRWALQMSDDASAVVLAAGYQLAAAELAAKTGPIDADAANTRLRAITAAAIDRIAADRREAWRALDAGKISSALSRELILGPAGVASRDKWVQAFRDVARGLKGLGDG